MSGFEIVKPESVLHAEKQAAKQLQLERRGIAREQLQALIQANVHPGTKSIDVEQMVSVSLQLADELLAKTKVEP